MDLLRTSVQSSRIIHKSASSSQGGLFASTFNTNHRKPSPATHKDSMEDIDAVKKLECWNFIKASNCLTRMNTAKESLDRKLKSEDIVEKELQKRKQGSENNLTDKAKSKYYKTYEEECLNSYKEIQNKLVIKIELRDNLRKTQIEQKNELDQDQLRLKEIERQRIFSIGKLGSNKTDHDQGSILIDLLKKRKSILKRNEIVRNELIQNIEMLQIEISNKAKELKTIEEEIDLLRKGLKLVKQDIIKHFVEILKQGIDTKGEGLYTTVKFLLTFNITLEFENFPVGIDTTSIKCIVELAEKQLELDKCYEKLASFYMNKGSVTHRPLSIKDRLSELKKTTKVRKPDFSVKKGRVWYKQELLNSSIETFGTCASESTKTEERIKGLKREIQDIKDNEVKRLTRECLKNGKDVRVLAAYIVGTDNLVKYKLVMLKEFQSLEKIKEKTRTFSFTEYLVPRPKLNLNRN